MFHALSFLRYILIENMRMLMKYVLFLIFFVVTLVANAQVQTNITDMNSLFNSYSSFKALNYGNSFTPVKNMKVAINGTKLNIYYEIKPGSVLRKCSVSFDVQKCQFERYFSDARKLSIYSKTGIDYLENSYWEDGRVYGTPKKEMLSYWSLETGNVTLTDRLINGFLAIQAAIKEQKIAPTPVHPLDNAEITLIAVSFTEPNSNHQLDKNETGCIKVRIKNNSTNDAYGIKVLLTEIGARSDNLYYDQVVNVDKISSYTETDVNIPIKASSNIENKKHSFKVELIYKNYVKTTSLSINSGGTNNEKGRKVIQMKKMAGETYLIACKVNGLPLNFIFDTGASSVTLSKKEAAFMLSNGYLSTDDIIGQASFQTADGNIAVGTIVKLKKIEISGLVLYNVNASIINNDNAPLLLGQSALSKLGKIQIDYNNSTLTIIR